MDTTKKDLFTRKLIFQHTEYKDISAVRTRSSNGTSEIILYVGSQSLTFTTRMHGDHYEMMAKAACETLDDAYCDRCQIPVDERL